MHLPYLSNILTQLNFIIDTNVGQGTCPSVPRPPQRLEPALSQERIKEAGYEKPAPVTSFHLTAPICSRSRSKQTRSLLKHG